MGLHDETKIPLKWAFALLTGASLFVGSAVGLGMYFGSRDAEGAALAERVAKLEQEIPTITLVDRRLARIEGALGVKAPEDERFRVEK